MKSSKIFTKGVLDVLPLLIPVVPFGLIIGVIGIELGFSPLMVYATSLIVFSGSAQIVFFQLISGGASPIVTLTSVGVTNSRHFLYGAVLSEYLEDLSNSWKAFLSYFLVDQSFALSNRFFNSSTLMILAVISIMMITGDMFMANSYKRSLWVPVIMFIIYHRQLYKLSINR